MVDLVARSPCAGLLPLTHGQVRVAAAQTGPMTALAPFRGQAAALDAALRAGHGMGLPAPGRVTTGQGATRALWFGRDLTLLLGAAPDPGLAAHAALSDQSDAWAAVEIDGRDAADVLARLTPLDLRMAAFGPGCTARTDLVHMAASLTRLARQRFLLLVFRSMAQTLVHELRDAMTLVAARGGD